MWASSAGKYDGVKFTSGFSLVPCLSYKGHRVLIIIETKQNPICINTKKRMS